MEDIKLLGDRVLIEISGVEETTSSGLIVTKNPEPGDIMEGSVVSVGVGKVLGDSGIVQSMNVKVGDVVLFQFGTKINVAGGVCMLVVESDIILIKKTSPRTSETLTGHN